MTAGIGADRLDGVRAELKVRCRLLHDLPAATHRILCKQPCQSQRVNRMSRLWVERSVAASVPQRWLQFSYLFLFKQFHLDAVAVQQVELDLCLGKDMLRLVDVQPAVGLDQIPCTGLLDQRIKGGQRVLVEMVKGVGNLLDALGRTGCHKAQQPREQSRQVLPPNGQCTQGIHQHCRNLCGGPRQADGHTVAGNNLASVSAAATFAGAVWVDDDDIVPIALQVQGTADADNAAADHGDSAMTVVSSSFHRDFLGQEPPYPAGRTAQPIQRDAEPREWCLSMGTLKGEAFHPELDR